MALLSHDEVRAILHTQFHGVVLMPPGRCLHCGTEVEVGTNAVAHRPPGHHITTGEPHTDARQCVDCGRLEGSHAVPPCSPTCCTPGHQETIRIHHPDGVIEHAGEHCKDCHENDVCAPHNAQHPTPTSCRPLVGGG